MQKLEQKEIVELIAGYLTGQLNEEQLDILKDWIRADKRNKQYFDDMREVWLAAPLTYPGMPFNKEKAYQLFLSRTRKKVSAKAAREKQLVYTWITRVAAAVVVGFVLGAFCFYRIEKQTVPFQVVSQYETIVPYGSRSRLVLADGTKVWLNSGSRLRYATDFGQTHREVYLEGEGYFDVAHDTTKIFIVKTDKIAIKALGTSFNVKAYPGESNIETVLVEGTVSIDDGLVLAPNEKCVYTRKNSQMLVEKKLPEVVADTIQMKVKPLGKQLVNIVETSIDPVIYTSWKDELWRIESETLGSLAVKLQRRYDVSISFADRGVQTLSVNAVIKDESLEQVLRFLQLSIPIDFQINGKSVVLKEDKYFKERYKNFYKQK